MNNIILGFNEEENEKIQLLLRQINYIVYKKCTSFDKILRMENELYAPIVITKEKLKDGNVYSFLNNTSNSCEHIIVTNKSQPYEFLNKTLYISNNINKNQLRIALNMLSNFNQIKLNTYVSKGNESYEEAKKVLITKFDFTENLAHKFIQQRCMNMCVKKEIISNAIIYSN